MSLWGLKTGFAVTKYNNIYDGVEAETMKHQALSRGRLE